ncbi:hypothetical protein STCU_06961 [Strigomonas culicis]|uniref:Uncharacterized protein n=1 Tax=Strigomonas culicis TaxID=28005 RepID=S9U7S9_9TRYP|nr:hypothetical protein STCU_06961 [Strigomonas culicis]|eukprot:EPY24874.1 hypothetical protein STCU_06961 [Strigomonas culicis]
MGPFMMRPSTFRASGSSKMIFPSARRSSSPVSALMHCGHCCSIRRMHDVPGSCSSRTTRSASITVMPCSSASRRHTVDLPQAMPPVRPMSIIEGNAVLLLYRIVKTKKVERKGGRGKWGPYIRLFSFERRTRHNATKKNKCKETRASVGEGGLVVFKLKKNEFEMKDRFGGSKSGLLLALAGSDGLADALLGGGGGVHLRGLLLHLLERDLVPRDGVLGVVLVEHLAGPVSTGAARHAQLVTLEVGRGREGLLRADARGGAGGGVLLERLGRHERLLERLRGAVARHLHGEFEGGDVAHLHDVAAHLAVLRVLDQQAVGVDDVDDHTDVVLARAAENAHQTARTHVVSLNHCELLKKPYESKTQQKKNNNNNNKREEESTGNGESIKQQYRKQEYSL